MERPERLTEESNSLCWEQVLQKAPPQRLQWCCLRSSVKGRRHVVQLGLSSHTPSTDCFLLNIVEAWKACLC